MKLTIFSATSYTPQGPIYELLPAFFVSLLLKDSRSLFMPCSLSSNTNQSSETKRFKGIFSFEQGNIGAITGSSDAWQYNNMLLVENYKPENEKGFKNFYFRTVTGG